MTFTARISDLESQYLPEDTDTDVPTDTEVPTDTDTEVPTDTDSDEPKPQPEKILYGDADMNGTVEMADVTLIQKAKAGLAELSTKQLLASDVNGDKQITMDDVVTIQKYKAELIKVFPVEENTSVG